MSNGNVQSFTFFSKRVVQRGFTLYLSSVKAGELERLCEGLRAPESLERPLDSEAVELTNDATDFVAAVMASSEFAAEVSRI